MQQSTKYQINKKTVWKKKVEEKFDAYAFDQHLKLKHTPSVYFHKKT